MPIPKNKGELREAINIEFSKLFIEFESIPMDVVKENALEGHKKETLMSIHNLASYLLGWGKLVLTWIESSQKNLDIIFPHVDYNWNQLGDLALKFYKDFEKVDFIDLLKALEVNKIEILKVVEDLKESELYDMEFYKHYPLGRMIQLNTSSPYKNARLRIRKWKKAKGL